jgi:hypothetical protein
MLMIFEVSESFDEDTMDTILGFVKSKKAKDQLVGTQLLSILMLAYGPKRFKPAVFGPSIEAVANSSAPANRAAAMECYKALFQWVGEDAV